MKTNGRVLDVYLENVGTTLFDSALTGATEINIVSAGDLDDNGGQVEILGEVYDYSNIVEYEEYDTIAISPPLLADAETGDEVNLYPVVQLKVAMVRQDDPVDDGQFDSNNDIEAYIAPGLAETFEIGDRDSSLGEYVEMDDGSGQWIITKVFGREGKVHAEAIVGTLPATLFTDGLAPSVAPVITSIGALSQVFIKWTGIVNNDPVTYQVHVSEVSGFIPDATTLLVTTNATMISAKTEADGTPFVYGTTYYFKVIPVDADGEGPASNEVSATMNQAGSADIAVGAVTAEKLEAILVLATQIATDTAGQRIEIDPGGIRSYDSADNLLVSWDALTGLMTWRSAAEGDRLIIAPTGLKAYTTDLVSWSTAGRGFWAAFSPAGNIYTSTYVGSSPGVRKYVYTPDGYEEDTTGWPKDEKAIIAAGRDGYIYTSDGSQIQKWDEEGVEITGGGWPLAYTNGNTPAGCQVDSAGALYRTPSTPSTTLRKFVAGVEVTGGGWPLVFSGPIHSVDIEKNTGNLIILEGNTLRQFNPATATEVVNSMWPRTTAGTEYGPGTYLVAAVSDISPTGDGDLLIYYGNTDNTDGAIERRRWSDMALLGVSQPIGYNADLTWNHCAYSQGEILHATWYDFSNALSVAIADPDLARVEISPGSAKVEAELVDARTLRAGVGQTSYFGEGAFHVTPAGTRFAADNDVYFDPEEGRNFWLGGNGGSATGNRGLRTSLGGVSILDNGQVTIPTLEGNVTVEGDLTVGDDIIATGDITSTGPLHALSDVDILAGQLTVLDLVVTDDVIVNSNVDIDGALDVDGAANVDGNVTIGGTLSVPDTIKAGAQVVTVADGASAGSAAESFAVPFASTPRVVACTNATSIYFATVSNVTASGFTVNVRHANATAAVGATPITVNWIAIPGTQ